jgi:hydrogenase maturation protein HypF
MGRLFDAAASLLGVRHEVTYEAQGAMELEALATESHDTAHYDFALASQPDPEASLIINPAPVWRAILSDLRSGIPTSTIASRFHRGVATAIAACCVNLRSQTGLSVVGLTGGVFQNVLLLRLATEVLVAEGFEVLTHRIVPPNDGGLALGQAAIAALSAPTLQKAS